MKLGFMLVAFGVAMATPVWSAECPAGFQPYGPRCVSQRMADYISCVEATGGNKQEIIEEVSKFGGQTSTAGADVKAKGPVISGAASAAIGRADEQKLARRLESRWFPNGASECSKVLDPKKDVRAAPGRLSIVDVRVAEPDWTKEDGFPSIDILLRNTGKIAVIKRAVIEVSNVWEWKTGWLPGAMRSTWSYTVKLPIVGAPYVRKLDLAQEVPAGGTDRFTITLGNDAPPTLSWFVFSIKVRLEYDEDNKSLEMSPIVFASPPALSVMAKNNGGDFIGAYIHNKAVVAEILKIKAKRSAQVDRYVESLSGDIVAELVASLSSDDPKQRAYAAKFLGRLGPLSKSAIGPLEKLRTDPDRDVSQSAQVAIEQIKSPHGGDRIDLAISPEIHKIIGFDEAIKSSPK